jgi:hypothetical protein
MYPPVLEAVSSAARRKQAQPVLAARYSTMSGSEAEAALAAVYARQSCLKAIGCVHWGLLARLGRVVGVPRATDS